MTNSSGAKRMMQKGKNAPLLGEKKVGFSWVDKNKKPVSSSFIRVHVAAVTKRPVTKAMVSLDDGLFV